ncbi:hypothetical protein [Virgibacillus pantothenticus]|uniref:hypothetical protein n=1 Tax=Virgibacillus pantothenticus TaxID=1473 RepID=UPI000984A001|nr:hypothetical protein [Virgibacillus pantothenticus]
MQELAQGGIHIYKYYIAFTAILVLFISGCSSSNQISNSDLEEYDVEKKIDESIQGDFVFRLVSDKKEYEAGDDVKLYGEITYVGDKDEVNIHHSSSAILFPMEEKVRGFDIGFVVKEIGLSTMLKQGEPYREEYRKSGNYVEDAPIDYVKFMEEFSGIDGFPPGYYVVHGEADFYLEGQERINMKATIDFKVVE